MAIALVASTQAGSTTGNNVTTSAINTTGANLIVVAVSSAFAGSVPTLTDSKGFDWSSTSIYQPSSTFASSRLFWAILPTVGAGHTFTVTSTAGLPLVTVFAFSGAGYIVPIYKFEGAATGVASSNQPSASFVNAGDGSAFVTGISNGGVSSQINNGYTKIVSDLVSLQHLGGGAAYKIQTTGATESPTWSWTGASESASLILAIRPPGLAMDLTMQDRSAVSQGVFDQSGFHNDGSFGNQLSQAYSNDNGPGLFLPRAFDGVSVFAAGDEIDFLQSVLFPANQDFTFEIFYQWQSITGFRAASPVHDSNTDGEFSLSVFGGRQDLAFNTGGDDHNWNDFATPDLNWHHLAIIGYANGTNELYLDGVSKGFSTDSDPRMFAMRFNNAMFGVLDGQYDAYNSGLRIYDLARDATGIAADMARGLGSSSVTTRAPISPFMGHSLTVYG